MWKVLIILCLPILAASLLMGQYLAGRRLKVWGRNVLALSGEEVLQKLLLQADDGQTTVSVRKRVIKAPLQNGELMLPLKVAEGMTTADAGRAVWLAGISQIEKKTPQVVKWWRGARTFGMVGPPLILLILVFAVFGMKLAASVAVALGFLAIGLSAGLCLLQMPLHFQAVRVGSALLERARVFHRLDDEEATIKSASAYALREALPGCLAFLLRDKSGTGKRR